MSTPVDAAHTIVRPNDWITAVSRITTARMVDDISVPASMAHPRPLLLEKGSSPVKLGDIVTVSDIYRATAQHKRIDFVTIQNDERSVVGVSIRQVRRGAPGSLVCIADLTRSSSIQLRAPIDTVAIMTVDVETGEAVLSCERIGLARVTNIREEPGDDCTYSVDLVFGGITTHWSIDVPRYKVNQLVPVRASAYGTLVTLV